MPALFVLDLTTRKLTLPALRSLQDFKWVIRGSMIRGTGYVNDVLVDIYFHDETGPCSSGFFGNSKTDVTYKSIGVTTTTPPSTSYKSDSSTRTFHFANYLDFNDRDTDIALTRSKEDPLVYDWTPSVTIREKELFLDIAKYVQWVTSAGF